MLRLARWPSLDGVRQTNTSGALCETFAHFAPRPPAMRGLSGAVVLDDGTSELWTVRIEHGRLSVEQGRARDAETTITGDPLTLAGIVRGKRGGIESFLRGRLRVRGNLSLALKLDGVFDRRSRPSDRAKPKRVEAAGIDTFYLEAGAGPPVILLHGLGATNASMIPTLAAVAAEHRVLAPDLPGFGDSAKPHAAYDAPFFARWLLAFMDAIGIHRASLVGNSMGGRVALETALLAPERIDAVALLAPSLAFRRLRHAVPIAKFLSPEMGALPLPALGSQARHGLRLLFSNPDRLPASWHDAATDEFLRVFRTPSGRVALFAAARQIYLEQPFGPYGFWSRLGGLGVPALFLWGDRDRMVPIGFARHVEQALPWAESVVLDDCGHIPQFEQPELTHRLVKDFFGRSVRRARLG